MSRRPRSYAALFVLVAALLVPNAAISHATDTSDGFKARPTRYVPSYIETDMGYDARGTGTVGYYFSWLLSQSPASADGLFDDALTDAVASFEIGWKSTGLGCTTTNALSSTSGFPASIYRGVDYTEDPGDAVLFIDTRYFEADVLANSNKLYAATWSCREAFLSFSPGPTTGLNVQLGDGSRPYGSNSRAQLQLVPPENAPGAFRARQPNAVAITTYNNHMLSDSNMEQLVDNSWFPGTQAVYTKMVNGGEQGPRYIRIRKADGSPGPSLVYQSHGGTIKLQNIVMKVRAGRPLQYEGAFRCRALYNPSPCVLTVNVGPGSALSTDPGNPVFTTTIPNDNRWYFIVLDDRGQSRVDQTYVKVSINAGQSQIDIDSQFVSTGFDLP